MADRYDENRERFEGGRGQGAGQRDDFEGGYQNRRYGQQGRGQEHWGGSQGRNLGPDYQGGPDWQGGENRNDYEQNYSNEQRRYGNQGYGSQGSRSQNYENQGFGNQAYGNQGYTGGQSYGGQSYGNRGYGNQGGRGLNEGNRGYNQSRFRNSTEGWQRDTDQFMDPGNMATSYPRQNEWSSASGIGAGLGGAENSEYTSNYSRGGSYSGGQGQFGGGLNQYGEQGRHAGRGPKGYKRSDERIKEDVNERLTQDPHIDAGDIEVQVKDGEVTLTGNVDSRQIKRRAEDMIENISGVREVHNQLRVQSGHEMAAAGTSGSSTGKQGSQNKEQSASTGHQSSKA